MTNTDQDVTLDEAARAVVEWMVSNNYWEMLDSYHIKGVGTVEELKSSLDLIREVEEALDENHFKYDYVSNLWEFIHHHALDRRQGVQEDLRGWLVATADPETRLRAIYRTLRESGEI